MHGIVFPCFFDLIDEGGYFGVLAKLAYVLVTSQHFQLEFMTDHAQHLHVLRDLLLREHTELQVQVRPLLGAAYLVFLVDENTCG